MKEIKTYTTIVVMALLILIVMLMGCGSGGGAGSSDGSTPNPNSPVIPPGGTPSCKPLGSLWNSTTNFEQHDFRGLALNLVGWTPYGYIGWNNVACPATDVGVVIQGIKLYPSGPASTNAGFPYTIEFHNNYPAVGCNYYQDGTGPSAVHGSAVVKLECNKLTICKSSLALSGECNEFN